MKNHIWLPLRMCAPLHEGYYLFIKLYVDSTQPIDVGSFLHEHPDHCYPNSTVYFSPKRYAAAYEVKAARDELRIMCRRPVNINE